MYHYIKFEIPEKSEETKKSSNIFKLLFYKLFISILKTIVPLANPDYEEKIENVKIWLLEFDDENSCPIREVGLDKYQLSIVKMPYKKNYGYWTDNELKLEDFKKIFKVKEIEKDFFVQKWNDLI